MSGYPGQGYGGGGYGQGYGQGGYPPQGGQYPPQQGFYPPQQPEYTGYAPQYQPPPQPQYTGGGGQYPPPQVGYRSGPLQQQYQPPQQQQYQPPQQQYQPPQQQYQPPQQQYQPPQQQYQPPGQQYGGQQYGGYQQQYHHPPPPPQGAQPLGQAGLAKYGPQYSNCTGRRKALLIGINYIGQQGQLRGCINDVRNLSSFLVEFYHYRPEDMVILTDDAPPNRPESQPTKANILRAMEWLVKGAARNDSLFFHYSGHGGQTDDLDGDEHDGSDEVIYPVDFRRQRRKEEGPGFITDDEMHRIMVKDLPEGTRLTAIFDSCHSGSALDLPFVYSTSGDRKEPSLIKDAGMGLLGAIGDYAKGDFAGLSGRFVSFGKKAVISNQATEISEGKASRADVVSWSGSKDDQTSADATIASKATGAMSHAFVSCLRENRNLTYLGLLNNIRTKLAEGKYTQKPQLACSHELDVNAPFVM